MQVVHTCMWARPGTPSRVGRGSGPATIVTRAPTFSRGTFSLRDLACSSAKNVAAGLLHMADTTHVGWKTEPVREDQGNGPERRSRPGTDWRLAGQGPRKARLPSRSDRPAQLPANCLSPRTARDARTAKLSSRRKRRQRPPQGATNGSQGPTSAGRRSILFSELPRRSTTACRHRVPAGKRRVDWWAS